MTSFVALIRAMNVGGKGMLPMTELRTLCLGLDLKKVRTYIQSGNVLFESTLPEPALRALLEQTLAMKMGTRRNVLIRQASELRSILDENPFPAADPARVGVVFFSAPVPMPPIPPGREELHLRGRELFIHYPDGMGRSKLRLPASLEAEGTMRNLNTVAKLVAMATE
jgi:uncharacterized protein (DUF1697 family)